MIIKCKMCGGDLRPTENATTCECEFCGTVQTIPNADNEKKGNLFNRANRLRMNNEFDKASAVYESIVAEFPEEAETYWGLCLCAYGIEYVDDPATGNKMTTCHRTLPTSIMEDTNFEQACNNADPVARKVYRDEAKAIDRIQKDILSIAANETPYDVFICYKETDENGNRTEDSVLAQEVYDALTAKELKVFFSRITLEDKLGVQYEPYIYAALSSAHVMLAFGTKYEYYDAVWVKNEWKRYLDMMRTDKNKVLIPCFKDLDAYDMPKEFNGLQAQDMSKLGWMQDLTRGVEKLCGKTSSAVKVSTASGTQAAAASSTVENLMKRARIFLEDGDFDNANTYLEKVLDLDAEYAPAYVGKLCIKLKLRHEEELGEQKHSLDMYNEWKKAMHYASDNQRKCYRCYAEQAEKKEKEQQLEEAYSQAQKAMAGHNFFLAIKLFKKLGQYADSEDQLQICMDECRKILETRKSERSSELVSMRDELDKQEQKLLQLQKDAREAENKLEWSAKNECDLANEISRLHAELEQVRGIFAWKKKHDIESKLDQIRKKQMEVTYKRKESEDRLTSIKNEVISQQSTISNQKEALKRKEEAMERKAAELAPDWLVKEALIQPGNYITFGQYPQTFEGTDNTTIEWLVLARNGKKTLLISRYGLDAQSYNKVQSSVTWETCTLRTWLNSTFMNKAFAKEEQKAILTTTVDNSSSQGYSGWSTSGGNNTKDQIFLLSYAEANKYFGVTYSDSNTKARVKPTAYADKQGAFTSSSYKTADGDSAGWWWLRSPGDNQYSAAYVFYDGSPSSSSVDCDDICVRPALWVNLESGIF